MFAQRQANVFFYRQSAEQPAVLKHHAPALAQGECLVIGNALQFEAQHGDFARVGRMQQDHLAQQG